MLSLFHRSSKKKTKSPSLSNISQDWSDVESSSPVVLPGGNTKIPTNDSWSLVSSSHFKSTKQILNSVHLDHHDNNNNNNDNNNDDDDDDDDHNDNDNDNERGGDTSEQWSEISHPFKETSVDAISLVHINIEKEKEEEEEETVSEFKEIDNSNHNKVDLDTNELHSIAPSEDQHSVDTVREHFMFTDYQFPKPMKKKKEDKKKLRVLHYNAVPKRVQRRMKKLPPIDELKCENDKQTLSRSSSEEKSFTNRSNVVLDMKHITEFVKSLKLHLLPIQELIDLCNQVAKEGIIHLENIKMEDCVKHNLNFSDLLNLKQLLLCDLPFVGERLRETFFRSILLLSSSSLIGSQLIEMRRKNWCGLTYDAKLLVTPLGTVETFRDLFAVHPSVTISELLSTKNMDSFSILEKAEWTRVVAFGEHLRSLAQHKLTSQHVVNKAQSLRLDIPAFSIADYTVEEKENAIPKPNVYINSWQKGIKLAYSSSYQEEERNTISQEYEMAEHALQKKIEWEAEKTRLRKNYRELDLFDDSSIFHSVFNL